VLRSRIIRQNPGLVRIFRVIERDEPSHCLPYQRWLQKRGTHLPGWEEQLTDAAIHYWLMLLKIPILFLSIRKSRLVTFPA